MGQQDDALAYCRAQIGKPYVFGTKGPDTFDCSGLIVAAYEHANPPITLPHWTYALINIGSEVARSELLPGDLVFPDGGHVQMYVGDGQMIEAQQKGVPVRQGPLWGFWRARRVVTDGSTGSSIGALASGVVDAIPTPLSIGASLTDVFRPFGVATGTLTKSQFWVRVGAFGIGIMLILMGIIYWMRRPIQGAIFSTVDTAKGLVGTAAQGAAFGVGAGGFATGVTKGASANATSVSAAPVTAISPRTTPVPRTPRAPKAVAAPLPEFDSPTRVNASSVPRTTRKSSRGGRFIDYGPVGKHRMYEGE